MVMMKSRVRHIFQHKSERGSILIMVAVAILGLLSFTAFTVDNGVLMLSRGQGQNSARGSGGRSLHGLGRLRRPGRGAVRGCRCGTAELGVGTGA